MFNFITFAYEKQSVFLRNGLESNQLKEFVIIHHHVLKPKKNFILCTKTEEEKKLFLLNELAHGILKLFKGIGVLYMIPVTSFQSYEIFKTEKGFEYMQVMHPDKISSILYEIDYAKNELYVDGISTHKDYQRNGLMALLMSKLLQWAKKTTKVMKIGLKCETEASRSFALKFGFRSSIIDLGDHDITHILELK